MQTWRYGLAMGIGAALALLPTLARALEAGNPNPPKDGSGAYLYPPDSPNTPYNPSTQTGRLDTLHLASPFSGVGSINGGTGTLLDATHVLTAAHLFGAGYSNNTGATFVIDTGDGTTRSFQSSAVTVDPLYQSPGNNDLYDLAVVTLATPVTDFIPNIKTYGLYTGQMPSGTTLTLVGYGASGDGVTGYNSAYGNTRHVGENNADGSLLANGDVSDTYLPGSTTYLYDFDSPDGSAPNFLGGGSLGNDKETNIGGGDSGGPAFISINGQYEIAALDNIEVQFDTDQGPGPTYGLFGSGGGGPVVSAYTDFIYAADPSLITAPEPEQWTAFGIGGLLLLGGAWRGRRRARAA